jgi:hypothetical protein
VTKDAKTGIDRLEDFTREERRHPIFKRFAQAFAEERAVKVEQLTPPQNIEQTTLLRGEIRMLSLISARTSEVGPESRQSEPDGPESASPARAAAGFPLSFER